MAEGGADRSMPETDNMPIHSSLYDRHSRNYVENVSVEVCHIMTLLGYGKEIRRRRVEKYRDHDMLVHAIRRNLGLHSLIYNTAGSKAEGLTSWAESDHDLLYVLTRVICVEFRVDLNTIQEDIEVYRMDTRVHPGHCRLLLARAKSTRIPPFQNALCADGKGNVMLSSGLFLDDMSKLEPPKGEVLLERAGPSLPTSDGKGVYVDHVMAVPCQCPSIMQRWAQRPRHWSPPNVVQKVVSLGSVVTPVGFKLSEYRYLEWRICFNMGETEIVNNLNTAQLKLYVILKMIVKELLKPKKKEITSYVLKNIILPFLKGI